jgi:uncharacterized membrane protein (UPF0127 family)
MGVLVNGQVFDAEYMTTPEQIKQGMMGRKELKGCMVFNMGKGHHRFWMRRCLIPLDIVFVSNNRISRIHHDCQPCDIDCPERYSGIGDHVVEFPSGTCSNFKVGDKVNLYLGTPQNPVQ